MTPERPANRTFLHFFDIHFLASKAGGREPTDRMKGECRLALRLAFALSREVLIPAASYCESPLCAKLVDELSQAFGEGRIYLVGKASNLRAFAENKLRQYREGSSQFDAYSELISNWSSRLPKLPPFRTRQRSATEDIAKSWLVGVGEGTIIESLKYGTGLKLPEGFERECESVPDGLEGRAFIIEHVADLIFPSHLFRDGVPDHALDKLHKPINEGYFASYATDLQAGLVCDLVDLDANLEIPNSGLAIPYKSLREALRRKNDSFLRKLNRGSVATVDELAGSAQWAEAVAEGLASYAQEQTDSAVIYFATPMGFMMKPSPYVPRPGVKSVRILHLSDIHFRGPREKEPWRRRRVLGPAWTRNLEAVCEKKPPDVVVFTGDIADWGIAEEYSDATEFFAELLDKLGVDKNRLFVVPGNHDVARKTNEDSWKELRSAANAADRQEFSRWMAGLGGAPPGIDASWRDQVLERQGAFWEWVSGPLGRAELQPTVSPHGLLGFRAKVDVPSLAPIPLWILGLNSAWLCGADDDSGNLLLTENQLMQLATDEAGNPLEGVRVALMHHPITDLRDGSDCRRLMKDHVDLVLRGHLHEPEVFGLVEPGSKLNMVAAGCLYEGAKADRYRNAFHVTDLLVDDDGKLREAVFRFRSWSPRGGHWYDDNGIYEGTTNGVLSWSLE